MKKELNYQKNFIIDLLVFFGLISYFYVLLSLIHPARHVDPDFFQFLHDSTYYLSGKLPPMIQSLPANPLLIGVFSYLAKGRISEIEVALLLNAVFTVAAIGVLYVVTRKIAGSAYGLLLTVFLMVHPIIFRSAISNNTEILFSLFLVFFIYLASIGYKKILYIISAIAILIRYESILLFPVLLSYELLLKTNFKKLILSSLFFLLPAVYILSVLLLQNNSQTVTGTPFFQEVIARKDDLPEFRFFTNLGFIVLPFLSTIFYPQFGYLLSILLVCLLGVVLFYNTKLIYLFKADKNKTVFITLLFSLFYLVFHMCFPAYLERYMVPIIFLLSYVFIVSISQLNSRKSIVFGFANIFILTVINVNSLYPIYKLEQKLASSDYYIPVAIAELIDNSEKYLVITPYPQTQAYYFRNLKNVELISVIDFKAKNDCDDLGCAFASMKSTNLLVPYSGYFDWGMYGTYDISLRRWYEDIGLYELGEYIKDGKLCELYFKDYPPYYVWIAIYSLC
jgi:4-amino-4-deoxy-L-arabinose transferase-like glycosyltransferase